MLRAKRLLQTECTPAALSAVSSLVNQIWHDISTINGTNHWQSSLLYSLAKTIPCGYTNPVKGAKLVHILLTALLCYGQVVSSVHAVEHLELADCEDRPSAGHHHHGALDDLSPLYTTDHQHPSLAHTHSQTDTQSGSDDRPGSVHHTELDCKIYHAFQNLNGIGSFFLQPLPGAARQNIATPYALQHFVSDSLEIPQIRAPPALS